MLRNKGTFLSLHQIEILKCKIGKEQDSELHFNKGVAFDDIHDVVERNKDNLKDKGIIAIKGTKIFYDVYADMVSMSIKMIINENEYVIDEIVGVLFEDFSCKFTIHEIVFKSGFSNRTSFYRAFLKKNGCTPKEFIEANKGR